MRVSLHAKFRHQDRTGKELSKARFKAIRKAIEDRKCKLLRYDNVRNRVLEIPHLGLTVVYSDIARKIVTVWPTKEDGTCYSTSS